MQDGSAKNGQGIGYRECGKTRWLHIILILCEINCFDYFERNKISPF